MMGVMKNPLIHCVDHVTDVGSFLINTGLQSSVCSVLRRCQPFQRLTFQSYRAKAVKTAPLQIQIADTGLKAGANESGPSSRARGQAVIPPLPYPSLHYSATP